MYTRLDLDRILQRLLLLLLLLLLLRQQGLLTPGDLLILLFRKGALSLRTDMLLSVRWMLLLLLR
jgi:hypothetical protein